MMKNYWLGTCEDRDWSFCIDSKVRMKICEDGRIYIMDCFVTQDASVYKAFSSWIRRAEFTQDGATIKVNKGFVARDTESNSYINFSVANKDYLTIKKDEFRAEGIKCFDIYNVLNTFQKWLSLVCDWTLYDKELNEKSLAG